VPNQIRALYETIQSLSKVPQPILNHDSHKRPWETSQEGYLHWAVQKLVECARASRGSFGTSSYLANLTEETNGVGSLDEVKEAAEMASFGDKQS
jgi:hypothetical protein